MDFLTDYNFVTIVSVVGSAVGLFLALRADLGKRIDRVEEGLGRRIDRVEEGLGKRIDQVEEHIDRVEDRVAGRIDRVEDGARKDHQGLVAEIGKLTTAVSVLGAKLDERSAPQRLAVQEFPADYSAGKPAAKKKTAKPANGRKSRRQGAGHPEVSPFAYRGKGVTAAYRSFVAQYGATYTVPQVRNALIAGGLKKDPAAVLTAIHGIKRRDRIAAEKKKAAK